MKKNNKILLLVCIIVVVITAATLYYFEKKRKEELSEGEIKSSSGTTTQTTTSSVFPLKKGSKGEEVKNLQRKINEYLTYYWFMLQVKPTYQTLSVDGIWGTKTESNVQYVFKKNQISEQEYKLFLLSAFNGSDNWFIDSKYSFLNLNKTT